MKTINKKNPPVINDIPLNKGELKGDLKAFTLVELIIVITILAILATIAFISFQGYMKSSRDGNRLATINSVSKGLDLFQIKTGNYPIPENITGTGQVNNQDLAFVGNIADNISRNININKIPQDPLSKTNYIYGTDVTKTKYQIAAVLEDTQASNIIINQTYADSGYKAKVTGNYNGLLKVGTSLYNLPSLIFLGTGNLINNSTGFIIDKSQNLPYKLNSTDPENTQTITQQLQLLTGTSATLELTGIIITNWNSQSGSLETAFGYTIDSIGQTYYGDRYFTEIKDKEVAIITPPITPTCSDGTQNGDETGVDCGGSCTACVVIPPTCTSWTYSTGTCLPDNTATLTIATSSPSGCTGGTPLTSTTCTYIPPVVQWKDISGNETCTNDDYVFTLNSVTYRWAGCNSTRGTTGTNADVYNGTCYNYAGGTTTINCNSTYLTGTAKEYDFNNSVGEQNIWGKLYLRANAVQADNACSTGWHVPTDDEFEKLETYLNGGTNCRNATDGWLCSGLGWKDITLAQKTTNANSIIKALKLPLAGYRISGTFLNRGLYTGLWASTEVSAGSTNARGRFLRRNYASVYRDFRDKATHGFSVRCVKDL